MLVRQEKETEAGRIIGDAMQLPNGKWKPMCSVVVFNGLPGDMAESIVIPVLQTDFDSHKEAAEASLEDGLAWFEKNVPTNR